MSDTASSSRPSDPSPAAAGDSGGVSAESTPSGEQPALPIRDDQPTIISSRPPLPTPAVSDSANRILRGKILPGDHLEHFELVRYVGGGGMGRVFRAVDTRLNRTVALKVLSIEQADDRETVLRFEKEAQSAARLDHENIARVFYVGEDRGLHFIAFEFIAGVNIRTLVQQKGPLPLAEVVSCALQIAEALAHAADRNVVHRDIKPSNVLITPEGRVKLIDMGLARLQRDDGSAADLTASGVTLGTFDYISPEQARDPRNADVRSDIYSLGCTLFYMLAGRPPFPEGTVLQKLLQHQGDQPPDVREFRPELPDEAAAVLRKMLAKDPRRRYCFPAELVEDLMALAEQIGLRPVGPGGKVLVAPADPKVSFLHRHLPWMVPIAALFCIVAVLHFYWSPPAKQTSQLPPPGEQQPTTPGRSPGSQQKQSPTTVVDPQSAPKETPDQPRPEAVGAEDPPPSNPPSPTVQPPESEPSDIANAEPPATPAASPQTDLPLDVTTTGLPHPFVADDPAMGRLTLDGLGAGMSAADGVTRVLRVIPDNAALAGHLNGATGEATEPHDVGPGPEPAPEPSGVLVVNDRVNGENQFPTLGAACAKAIDGDVIELRFSGRREEQPIVLANLNLEIRAGTGYQPAIVFRPGKEASDPVKYPRSMFTVTAGHLTLIDVALELRVSREIPAENWSLFETRGAPTVTLRGCSLSIQNASNERSAYQPGVSFFRTKSAPGAEAATADDSAASMPRAVVDLGNCIARGEAVFVRAEDLQPVHLIWQNGLLATTEWLLSATGSGEAPPQDTMIQVDLRHLTASVGSGLCRLSNTATATYGLRAEIYCADSILIAAPGAALIEQTGVTQDDFHQGIRWIGKGNFYEDFDVFWTIYDVDQEPLSEPMAFEAWKLHWEETKGEYRPALNRVKFEKLPEAERPMHTLTPADFTLAAPSQRHPNPVIGAAAEGADAGFQADQLPQLPAEEPVEGSDSAAAPG